MADVKKIGGMPDEQGKNVKKVGEIKIAVPIPDEEGAAVQPPESFILETEITREPGKDETQREEEPAKTPPQKPTPQKPAAPTPAAPISQTPASPAPQPPKPGGPGGKEDSSQAPQTAPGGAPSQTGGPSPAAGLSPQTSAPGTMESGAGPRPPSSPSPQPQKPPGQPGQGARPPVQPIQPLPPSQGPQEGQGPPDSQGQSGPGSERPQGPQQGPAPQDQLGMLGEFARQEAAQKAMLWKQIQSDERAAGRAHLIELIAQAIVNGFEFVDSLLKFLGDIVGPIPVLGWIVRIIVWISRGIVTLLEFLPKGVAKGERKDEDRLRKRALKLRKEAGIKTPPPPDNPHGTTEIPAEGLAEDDVRFPVLNLIRPASTPKPLYLLPGLFKINPPLSGILRIFIIAGGAAMLLISLSGLISFMQSKA